MDEFVHVVQSRFNEDPFELSTISISPAFRPNRRKGKVTTSYLYVTSEWSLSCRIFN